MSCQKRQGASAGKLQVKVAQILSCLELPDLSKTRSSVGTVLGISTGPRQPGPINTISGNQGVQHSRESLTIPLESGFAMPSEQSAHAVSMTVDWETWNQAEGRKEGRKELHHSSRLGLIGWTGSI
jgi:hypothetical protein